MLAVEKVGTDLRGTVSAVFRALDLNQLPTRTTASAESTAAVLLMFMASSPYPLFLEVIS
jgi:hypothetical protein